MTDRSALLRLRAAIDEADAIVVGAGAGLSTSAGFAYSGKRFERLYRSCLDTAEAEGLRSIAFCCISTGIFGFPQKAAAEIAMCTVRGWLDETDSDMTVVFNVFGDKDERIYRELLSIQNG